MPRRCVERQLRGADVHAAVELHGVGVDDLAAEPLGEVEREIGLAGAGRSGDHDQPAVPRVDLGRGDWRCHECAQRQEATR